MDERILLIEDDVDIREITERGLRNNSFDVISEADGRIGLMVARRESFDAVLLDIMLPSLDGIEICRHLREQSVAPIVIISAKDSTADVIRGLEAGADDYLTKPFEIDELVARLRSALRRATLYTNPEVIRVGDIEIDVGGFRVARGGAPISLTATEFKLLVELARNRGRVLTREMLLERVWDYDYASDSRIVDMAIKRLRSKIESDPSDPSMVQTVRGVGYRIKSSVSEPK